jgi:dihydroorotate dehydrogenase (fumarate)
MDLSTTIANIPLLNCVYNASGVHCITEDDLQDLDKSSSAVIQTKSCTLLEREGNPLPRYYEMELGTINSSGLPNVGYKFYGNISKQFNKKPYIVSVSGLSHDDNLTILEYLNSIDTITAIELNLSCPNIIGKSQTGYDFKGMDELLRKVYERDISKKLGLKLPPYFDIYHFQMAAEIIDEYKIDYLTCINSIGNGLVINQDTDCVAIKPKNGFGGIGGQIIKPTALANVRKFYELTKCDIVGCGGVTCGRDIYEHILCGAKAVQVGSQLKKEGVGVFDRLLYELTCIMKSKNYRCIEDFRGKLRYFR